jgi:hypothetical protein
MAQPFVDRAGDMGLDISMAYKGLLKYEDIHSHIIYRQLCSMSHQEECPSN